VGPFVSFFADCARRHSVKLASLPRERAIALGIETLLVSRCAIFVKRYDLGTRQSNSLSSVTFGKATSIPLFYLFLLFHPNKQKIYHIYITNIT
jgi:hypothetical protein